MPKISRAPVPTQFVSVIGEKDEAALGRILVEKKAEFVCLEPLKHV